MDRKDYLKNIKRIVVKVGTSTLTNNEGINFKNVVQILHQIVVLKDRGYEVILVTSGAIGVGMKKLNLNARPKTIREKQACAAIGQAELISLYGDVFSKYNKICAQILLTADDMGYRDRFLNARNTFFALLEKGVIPIVNENDTIIVDEIKFGDNDTLSAKVASLTDSDLLIILTDIDGVYDKNPNKFDDAKLISEIDNITEEIVNGAGGSSTNVGTGGMVTKIEAAKICMSYGIDIIVAKSSVEDVIIKSVEGNELGTIFRKNGQNLKSKKHWLLFQSKVNGDIIIDNGAEIAIRNNKSLLPVGVKSINGHFKSSDTVNILDEDGEKIAVGITYFSSMEIKNMIGKDKNTIKNFYSYNFDEIVHVDNIVVISKQDD